MIRTPQPGDLLAARLASQDHARQHVPAEQAHAQMRRNGSVPQPNPWRTAPGKTERLLRSMSGRTALWWAITGSAPT